MKNKDLTKANYLAITLEYERLSALEGRGELIDYNELHEVREEILNRLGKIEGVR